MKLVESTLMLFLITIVDSFVEPPFLGPVSPHLVLSPLEIKRFNPNAGNKKVEKTLPVPLDSHVDTSYKKFLDFPRSQYVDKTLFIKDVLNLYADFPSDAQPPATLITRPRGFGKTLALSSLYYFLHYSFKNTTALFSGLKIMGNDPHLEVLRGEYMSKFPVVWVDFATVKFETFEENFQEIKRIISNIFRAHEYVWDFIQAFHYEKEEFQKFLTGEAEETDFGRGLTMLCWSIFRYNNKDYSKKPIILIDNYDVPFHTGYKYNFSKRLDDLMWSIYGDATRGGIAHKVILTGVTEIWKGFEIWDLTFNNVYSYIVLEAFFSNYFGLNKEEVEDLLRRSSRNVPLQTLTDMYGGYLCENITVFNPLSVGNELFSQKSYQWAEVESKEQLGKFIVEYGFYPLLTLQQVLAGECVEKPIAVFVNLPEADELEINYWSYLAHAGYVTVLKAPWRGKGYGLLRIPNLEVRRRIESLIKEHSKAIPLYTEFTELLINGKSAKAKVFIVEYIKKAGKYLRNDEDGYNMNKLHDYVKQMLRGVETYYNTTMSITGKNNEITMEIEASKGRGEPVTVTIEKVITWGESWDRLKSKTCSVDVSSGGRKKRIIVMAKKAEIDVCVV